MRLLQTLVYPVFGVLRSLLNPARWFELPRKLGRVSLPALAALGTLLLLTIILLAVFWAMKSDQGSLPGHWLIQLPVAVLLIGLIAAGVYYAVYLWQIPDYETFDDIQDAWEKGVAELNRVGLDIYDLPLFLVLGGEGQDRIQRLFRASGLELDVLGFPPGHSALHWYAGGEAVFVVCSDVGCLTKTAQQAMQRLANARPEGQIAEPAAKIDFSRTLWPTQSPDTLDRPADGKPPDDAASRLQGPSLMSSGMDMTLQVPADSLVQSRVESAGGPTRPEIRQQRYALDGTAVNEQIARLEQLCRLISAARQPRAPLNGVVTVLPLNMVLCDVSEGADIKQAALFDLETLVRSLRVRCPTFAIVSDWEDDVGFQELVRRLPADKRHNPFGKGNRPGDAPTPDRLEAVAKNAVAAFEDWIYHLFKQPDAVTKPGNRQLYMLLCKVRRYLNPRVVRIVADGYSCGEGEETGELFGGCYFVAAGRDPPAQAFVRGVFHKIVQQHKELEWTSVAKSRERWCRRVAVFAFSAAVVLLMVAVVLGHKALFPG